MTDTTHRTEAARRTAAASGDGALALLEACRENVALRRRVAELEALWTEAQGAAVAHSMHEREAEARAEELVEYARRMEWAGAGESCLSCGRFRGRYYRGDDSAHAPECGLAALLEKEASHG